MSKKNNSDKLGRKRKKNKKYYYDCYGLHLIDSDGKRKNKCTVSHGSKSSKCNCPRTTNFFTSKYCGCNKPTKKKVKVKISDPKKFGNCCDQLHVNTNNRNIRFINFCYPVGQIEKYNTNVQISQDCDTFRVGMHVNTDPEAGFSFIRDGCLDGYDIAISQLIAKKLNKKLVIVDVPFLDLIDALQTGKIDMIASQMNKTSYRSDKIAQISYAPGTSTTFSLALLTSVHNQIKGIVQKNDYITAFNQLGKISGIAVHSGTSQEHYLLALKRQKHIPNLSIVVDENIDDVVRLIKNGYILGYLTDSPVALNDPEIINVQTSITIPSEFIQDFAIGLNIQYCDFIDKIFSFTNKLYQAHILEKLSNRYRGPIIPFILEIVKPICRDTVIRYKTCSKPASNGLDKNYRTKHCSSLKYDEDCF